MNYHMSTGIDLPQRKHVPRPQDIAQPLKVDVFFTHLQPRGYSRWAQKPVITGVIRPITPVITSTGPPCWELNRCLVRATFWFGGSLG